MLRGGQLVEERWHKVKVGDIIKMENNQFVAVSGKGQEFPGSSKLQSIALVVGAGEATLTATSSSSIITGSVG